VNRRRPRSCAVLTSLAAGCVLLAAACTSAAVGTEAIHGSPSPSPSRAVTVQSVDPHFDFGQTIFITSTGFRPAWLVSAVHVPITFRNMTDRPQRIVFDHQPVRSGRIPPGGSWEYTPPLPISMTYHAVRGATDGRIQVSTVIGASP
jgi:hypothetical protein